MVLIASTVPVVSMSNKILTYRTPDLCAALNSPLPFKIAVMDQQWVNMYPDALCLGRAEYHYSVDVWLQRGWAFGSETAVTALDQMWVNVLTMCLGGVVLYLNQHDPSSAARIRPDTTVTRHGALLLKGEAKREASEMEVAKEQLLKSFFRGAVCCFPRSNHAVLGVTTCGTTASIYRICWVDGRFSLALHRDYNLQEVASTRLDFIVDIFKATRWMVTVDAPVSAFHMIPSVRQRTRNGNYVTWGNCGILKQYRDPRDHVIARILEVYAHRLQHVEWGEAVLDEPNAVLITRVAMRLMDALAAGAITPQDAINHVRLGVEELHSIGYAHCDIVVENVFVDDGVAFLDDLEYLTPVDDAAPPTARWDRGRHPGLTARALDELLLGSFSVDVLSA